MEFNSVFKELNTEFNPICHLLVLLVAHHILHVSRLRVKRNLSIRHNCFKNGRHILNEISDPHNRVTVFLRFKS